jgi:glycerol uptake facilitator-like aquaporin
MDLGELIGEFIGTLIISYGASTSNYYPLTVAGCIYIGMAFTGYISMPQFNPAVTFSMFLRRFYHKEFTSTMALQFFFNVLIQFLSVLIGALLGWGTTNDTFSFHVRASYTDSEAFFAEMIYTAVVCATCLTVKRITDSLILAGGAISIAYLTGMIAVNRISYACFNPALAFGMNLVHYAKNGHGFDDTWIFILAPMVGAVVGTVVALVFIEQEEEVDSSIRTKSVEGRITS